jgi:Fucose 4-O-acetylase and related acetyltransferases
MRILALDVAKGVGILLVVFGHVWRGAFDAGLAISEGMYRLIDNAIYAFHMPLFFSFRHCSLSARCAGRWAPC